jgi:hypothetical protein
MVALVVATLSYAQNSLLATLSHDGDITTFYGASALKQAHEAAEHGDVITLSSGTFTSTDITKAITLRGAGWKFDVANHKEPTILSGDFDIDIPDNVEQRLTIEGIYHNSTIYYWGTLNNPTFIKNRFNSLRNSYNGNIHNGTFINCRITHDLQLSEYSSSSCVNCVIWNPRTNNAFVTSNFECVNCVLGADDYWPANSQLKNCILHSYRNMSIPNSTTVFNCIALLCEWNSSYGATFANIPNNTNTELMIDTDNAFKTYKPGPCLDDETFELTDEAKAKYLGTDGTEVGMYGGMLPFSSTTTNPQITKCNVAAKSTADGKLSVDIEVSSAE